MRLPVVVRQRLGSRFTLRRIRTFAHHRDQLLDRMTDRLLLHRHLLVTDRLHVSRGGGRRREWVGRRHWAIVMRRAVRRRTLRRHRVPVARHHVGTIALRHHHLLLLPHLL